MVHKRGIDRVSVMRDFRRNSLVLVQRRSSLRLNCHTSYAYIHSLAWERPSVSGIGVVCIVSVGDEGISPMSQQSVIREATSASNVGQRGQVGRKVMWRIDRQVFGD